MYPIVMEIFAERLKKLREKKTYQP